VWKYREWLSAPNPSTNHNIKYDSTNRRTTPRWLIEEGTFAEWKSKPNSPLWIQRKPGSGKSFLQQLCSAVMEHIRGLQNDGRATLAYFQFDLHDVKRNLHNALFSLLIQLAEGSDSYCDILSDLYEQKEDGGSTPDIEETTTCLKDMLTDEGPVYIIFDALDECSNTDNIPSSRTRVLDFLKRLVDPRLSNLHLCVTSQPGDDTRDDIGTALKAFRTISLPDQKEVIDQHNQGVVYANSDTPNGRL